MMYNDDDEERINHADNDDEESLEDDAGTADEETTDDSEAESDDEAYGGAQTPEGSTGGSSDSSRDVIQKLNDKRKQAAEGNSENNGDGTGTGSSKEKPSETQGGDVDGQADPAGKKTELPKSAEDAGKNAVQDAAKDATKKAGEEASKKAGEEVAKKAGEQAVKKVTEKAAEVAAKKVAAQAAFSQIMAALAPILFWVAVIVIIIVIVIGVLGFLLLAPGQIIGKLKQMAGDFIDLMQTIVEGTESLVSGQDIADVAEYIESMGYDLKGEGFVSKDIKTISETIKDKDGNVIDSNTLKVDNAQGVVRDEQDNIVLIESDPIRVYLVSDTLCYVAKNFNTNLKEASTNAGFWGGAAILGLVAVVAGFVVAPLAGLLVVAGGLALFVSSGNPDWGTGLISIYHEGGRLGARGSAYDESELGFIELDPSSKKMTVKRGWANQAETFDIDGWSGRYGMPLEFLVSVHLATQMPDLAVSMATTFDTNVEVLLHEVNDGSVEPAVKTSSGYLSWGTIEPILTADNNFFENLWNGILDLGDNSIVSFWQSSKYQSVSITDDACKNLFAQGFPHSSSCSCCEHITGGAGRTDGESCGDGDDVADHYICDNCKAFVKKVTSGLMLMADTTWQSYTPYISKVTDHWFRDVYFVIDNSQMSQGVVQTDEQYFYETNERWTLYETYAEGESMPEGFEVGDYKLYSYDTATQTYTLSNLSRKEVDEINEKIASGDTSVTRLVKKPKTALLDDLRAEGKLSDETFYDFGWAAYAIKPPDTGADWQKFTASEESPDELKDDEIADLLYYKEDRPNDIEQIEDGQRMQTNNKIKEMFLDKAYYKFDGSVERANAIAEDKEKITEENGGEVPTDKFDTDDDPRDEELISKVSLAKDSLTAFSMLENTHTLDADYIYRDFKELVVELDYFDKEDLSDKIQTVMQWPIPDCGSGGWPIRKYEKGDTFYGTLINSMVDIELMTNADVEAAEKLIDQLKNEVDPENPDPVSPTGNIPSGSVEDLVKKGYEVHTIMETTGQNGGWDYCIYNDSGNSNHHAYGHSCGLDSTIQEAQTGHNNTCCATFVSWVLKEAGFDLSNHPGMHGAKSTYEWCKAEGWTPITDYSELEPGDLLFNKGANSGTGVENIGHVQLLGDNGEWLNAGSVSAINDPPKVYTADFIIGMRSQLKEVTEPFKGYEPNQDVVSPLTGKVIEHGEVERENEETGEKETVEFIKIEAIDKYIYDPGTKGKAYLTCTSEEDTFKDKVTDDSRKNLEGYDYFYQEYQGVLDGYVLYIEGFDLTLFDGNGAISAVNGGDRDSSEVTRYIPNAVYNMTDDLEEARSIWKEDAKTAAIPLIEIDGELYIKEGTVIGKTYEDPDMSGVEITSSLDAEGQEYDVCKGNGNYIRLILRNLEDSVVEDVESYIPLDDTKKVQDLEMEKFLYWMGIYGEGGNLERSGDRWISVPVDLSDGAGATHYFGLTHYNLDIAKKLGYNISNWGDNQDLEMLVDVYLALIEQQKAKIREELGEDISDGYLQAFISILHNYGNLTKRGDEYKASKQVSESTWCTYEGTQYAAALTKRRIGEWKLIQEGKYYNFYDGNDKEIDFTDGGKYSEETPFTDWCADHGIVAEVKSTD